MFKVLLVMVIVGLCGCLDSPNNQPSVTATTMPEVNDENCKPDSIRAMPDNDSLKKFSGLCLRRGVLQKGPDQGLKM